MSCQPWAQKLLPRHNRFHGGNQFVAGIRLQNVTMSARGESRLRYLGIEHLTHEEYFGIGSDLANVSSGSNSIQLGESDVQQNQIRLQIVRFQNRFNTVACNSDNLKPEIFLDSLKDKSPPIGKIIDYEDTDNGLLADSFSLF
jgi:hypothetical protein